MKMQSISLKDIVPNPWRDMTLYPFDEAHVAALIASIDYHGFFGGVKGRRRNGKVELGCGHMRIEAARAVRPKLETVPIFVGDLDDDEMLRLMTDENATQAGSNPGAVMNEVAAVTRRIIDGLLSGRILPDSVTKAFEDERQLKRARTKLQIRLTEPEKADIHLAIGHGVIARYLGHGDPKKSSRSETQIREAITTLKQAGRYDDIVDEAIRKYPQPVATVSKSRAVATIKPRPPRRRILDERTANVFPNDHQFHAFREAVTTPAAQRAIPVEEQLALAKSIMKPVADRTEKKQVSAAYVKRMVQAQVEEQIKAQREISREEKEAYLAERREEKIKNELENANMYLRSLLSALARVGDLNRQYPGHPKIGGFAARLDTLVGAIQQFSKKIK